MKINIGGKFSFSKLPKDIQEKVKAKLAEKSEVLKQGNKGILPGIKIDGKVVTKENIHEFEKKGKKIKKKKKSKGYTKEELEKLSFLKLRKIGNKLGVKGRSKKGLIIDILNAQ